MIRYLIVTVFVQLLYMSSLAMAHEGHNDATSTHHVEGVVSILLTVSALLVLAVVLIRMKFRTSTYHRKRL